MEVKCLTGTSGDFAENAICHKVTAYAPRETELILYDNNK